MKGAIAGVQVPLGGSLDTVSMPSNRRRLPVTFTPAARPRGISSMNYDHQVFPTTRGVSVYMSDAGFLVIEQEQEDHQEDDQLILIHPKFIKLFVNAVKEATKGL